VSFYYARKEDKFYMKHFQTYRTNLKKQNKMIQAQQKIIDRLADQNDRLVKRQHGVNNQISQLHDQTNELKNTIANFSKYNTTYDSLLHDLEICVAEYKSVKKDTYRLQKKYKKDLRRVLRKIRR